MSTALISYQYEDESVRVVMVGDAPWFVAKDIALALGYRDAANLVRVLDDDERGTHLVSTVGGMQDLTIISEGGMYHAIFKSRREEAQRFRKWVTADVLPELRRHGRYQLHDGPDPVPEIASDMDPHRMHASVAVVREARRLFGAQAARNIWAQVGLPLAIADSTPSAQGDPLSEPLAEWVVGRQGFSVSDACEGVGIIQPDRSALVRVGAVLRLLGYRNRVTRIGHRNVRLWYPIAVLNGEGGDA